MQAKICIFCEESITAEDNGIATPFVRVIDGKTVADVGHVHKECQARAAMGSVAHLEHRCSCYGIEEKEFPGTYREEALIVWSIIQGQ
jgi:hypothetical protein